MSKMIETGIPWLPQVAEGFSVGYVKQFFYVSKDLSNEGEPERVLKLARAGIVEKDVTTNEGQMAASYAGYNKVQIGDLLLNPMDLYSGANCNVSELNGVISPAYSNLRVKKTGTVVPKYYDYYFKSQYWLMAMFAHGKGVSFDNRWTLNNDSLKSYEIPVLPFEKQQQIVKCIQAEEYKIDALVANSEAQIEKLKKYKQSLISEVVTKGLDPAVPMKDSGVEWIGEIPHDWAEARIKDVIKPIEKEVLESDEIVTCFRDGVVTLRRNRREDGFTVSFTEHGYHGVDIGDLVIHGMDAFAGAIGCSDSRGKITPVVHVCKTVGNNRYFMYYLRFMAFGNILMDLSNGVRIRSSDFRNFARLGIFGVVVPPISEQDKIVDYLDTKCTQIDRLIAIKQAKIEKLNQYKKSLIYEYVTGKKEVVTTDVL